MTSPALDVLQVSSVHRWDDNRIFHKQCKSLAAHGRAVTLLAVDAPTGRVDGVEVVGVPHAPFGRVGRFLVTVPRMLWRTLRARARIVHVHDPELLLMALVNKLFGSKIVYDVHEDYPLDILSKPWIPAPLRRPVAAISGLLERVAVRGFDAVVAATPSIGARLSQYNPNTVVVANYPRVEELNVPPESSGEGRTDVVYIGYLTEIRGIRVLVDAMKDVPARLLLAGKFTDPALEEYVRSRLSPGRIEFVGWVDRENVGDLLRRAAVGVVPFLPEPSHLEALPNKLFEYMAAGIPVVASDFAGWKELIEGMDVGWCARAGDAGAVAEKLRAALADPEGARERGQRGRAAVEARLNWRAAFENLLRAYSLAAGERVQEPGGARNG